VPTTGEGNAKLLAWAHAVGESVRGFAIEGMGSYGASLTRSLPQAGEFVVEAARPRRDRQARRNDGKSDAMDALRAARALLCQRPVENPQRRPDTSPPTARYFSPSAAI
jgi:transposase